MYKATGGYYVGFSGPMLAPGTSGDLCIAEMRGEAAPVVLADMGGGASALWLNIAWRRPNGTWASRTFGMGVLRQVQLTILGGAVAILAPDIRFQTAGFAAVAFSASPIVVERFEHGDLVDVSRQFPELITENARKLRASWFSNHGQYAGYEFAGLLPGWVADECRLGASSQAWATAEYQLYHGRYSHFFEGWVGAAYFLRLMRTDLTSWGYCPAS